ncbi:MAG: hypothetical protein Q9188_002198 [Gyalolechia gomerana]
MGSYNASTVFIQGKVNLQAPDESDIHTVPELIEHNALHNPHHLFCTQAQKQSPLPGFNLQPVSHLQLRLSIARCQAWLVRKITQLRTPLVKSDGTVEKGGPIALLVESDVGLLVHLFSFMGLGVPVLLLSPRLAPTAVHHLLHKTAACALIASPRFASTAREGLSLFPTGDEQPSLYTQASWTTFLEEQDDEEHLKSRIYKSGYSSGYNDRNVLILHSSGTTGLPKPVYQSHLWLLGFTTCHELYTEDEALSLNLSTLPLYHGYGLVAPALSLGIGKTLCIPPPSIISTGVSIINLLKHAEARSLMSVPSILEEIATLPDEQGIEALASQQFVAFGGGLLKRSVGLKLVAGGVKVLNHYGSTESGPIAPFFVPRLEYDWNYFRIRRDVPVKLAPNGSTVDDNRSYTLTMRPLGWDGDFVFQDQLINNPRQPNSDFRAVGRTDDLIVLANGEKVMPQILESALFENEHVRAAMAFGEGRFELGVIVQPSSPVQLSDYDSFRSLMWPIILKAMRSMDAHARIASKEAIVVVSYDTVLPRSDKGSLMRREVYQLFDAEIAAVYASLEQNIINTDTVVLDMDDLERNLKDMIQSRLAWKINPADWTFSDDLFELGMDSLQAVQLRRHIMSSLPVDNNHARADRVPRDVVYQNSTVSDLARFLRSGSYRSPREEITVEDLVQQFTIKAEQRQQGAAMKAVVLVTGGTGGLGSHLIAHLLSLSGVARVLSLNRPDPKSDAQTRQFEAFQSQDINISPDGLDKLKVFQSETASSMLGLSYDDYAQVQDQVTHIVHNAWPMDFKRTLPSFQAQFQTLRNLLQLAISTHHVHTLRRPKILFVSSIATVGQYSQMMEDAIVPEAFTTDDRCANDIGYAKAKLVCERIIENAAHNLSCDLDIAFVRVGQLSGSSQSGRWNTNEHLAALFKSSQVVGNLPRLKGTLSWTPVDLAAATVAEIVLCRDSDKKVYHLENPIRQPWVDVLQTMAASLNIPLTKFLPFDVWMDKICAVPAEDDRTVPVKRLETFFRTDFEHMACGNVILDTGHTREISPTLRRLTSISNETIASYVRHWKSVGYLD